jgi:uncharacterized protein
MSEMNKSEELTLEKIKTILKKNKAELYEKYKVRDIGIFGSYIRDEQKTGSDVDILVEFDDQDIPGLYKFITFEQDIEKMLRKKVDLVRRGAIRPELADIILKEVVYI